MKKFISFLAVVVACIGCFAGTLHIRKVELRKREYEIDTWIFKDVAYSCVFERSAGNTVWFKKSDGGHIVVGPGIEWWYED